MAVHFLICFPDVGAPIGICSRCVWAKLGSPLGLYPVHCTQGLDTLDLLGRLGARLPTLFPKQFQACQHKHVPI